MNIGKLQRNLVLAARSLWLHKMRSALSVLGIIIGNMAVITLMAFGEGSKQVALDAIRRQGATNIIVRSTKPPDQGSSGTSRFVLAYGLTTKDYEQFLTIPDVIRSVRMRVFPQEVRNEGKKFNGRLVATTPEYAEVNKIEIARGRFLTDKDDYYLENVCVLAAETADYLFPFEDPVGQSVMLNSHYYRIVGVMKDRMPTGGSGGSQAAEDYNSDVYMPLKTCNARYGKAIVIRTSGSMTGEEVALHQVVLTLDANIDTSAGREKIKAAGNMVREILDRNHGGKKDYLVTVPLDILEQAEETQNLFTLLLVVIASISLLVGGIGIMNIMLANVTERTREIGIRRALGAKRRDIVSQFLIEAIVQTAVGGVVGVLFGVVAIYLVPPPVRWIFEKNLPAKLMLWPMGVSLAVSIGVGVMFGLYPAWRASRLDPIEALRHV